MNRRQKVCLWIGISAFVLMGLFPPWVFISSEAFSQIAGGCESFAGYRFFIQETAHVNRIDTTLLLIQWTMVVVVTAGLVLTFRHEKRTS